MKDFFVAAITAPLISASIPEDPAFWERMAEKWGIALFSMLLFSGLAWWSIKREERLQQEREKREAETNAERAALLQKNNDLIERMLKQNAEHSNRLETIIQDGNKAKESLASATRELTARLHCVKGQ